MINWRGRIMGDCVLIGTMKRGFLFRLLAATTLFVVGTVYLSWALFVSDYGRNGTYRSLAFALLVPAWGYAWVSSSSLFSILRNHRASVWSRCGKLHWMFEGRVRSMPLAQLGILSRQDEGATVIGGQTRVHEAVLSITREHEDDVLRRLRGLYDMDKATRPNG